MKGMKVVKRRKKKPLNLQTRFCSFLVYQSHKEAVVLAREDPKFP
jgi:hypothetical protein